MSRFDNVDGTWLALGAAAALGLIKRARGARNQLPPFDALKVAVLEVWSAHPDYEGKYASQLTQDIDDWLVAGDPAEWSPGPNPPFASVFHEYATAPREPYSYAREGDYFNTWKRVEKRASELAGVPLGFESINPAVSQWWVETR